MDSESGLELAWAMGDLEIYRILVCAYKVHNFKGISDQMEITDEKISKRYKLLKFGDIIQKEISEN